MLFQLFESSTISHPEALVSAIPSPAKGRARSWAWTRCVRPLRTAGLPVPAKP